MVLLGAHKKWFKFEIMKANVAWRKAIASFGKIKKAMEGMEAHRMRTMMIGYYLFHTADSSPDEAERRLSYECVDTLHYGFNRRKLLMAHQLTGLDRLLKIEFEKV